MRSSSASCLVRSISGPVRMFSLHTSASCKPKPANDMTNVIRALGAQKNMRFFGLERMPGSRSSVTIQFLAEPGQMWGIGNPAPSLSLADMMFGRRSDE